MRITHTQLQLAQTLAAEFKHPWASTPLEGQTTWDTREIMGYLPEGVAPPIIAHWGDITHLEPGVLGWKVDAGGSSLCITLYQPFEMPTIDWVLKHASSTISVQDLRYELDIARVRGVPLLELYFSRVGKKWVIWPVITVDAKKRWVHHCTLEHAKLLIRAAVAVVPEVDQVALEDEIWKAIALLMDVFPEAG